MRESHRQAIITAFAKRHAGDPPKSKEQHRQECGDRHRRLKHQLNDARREKRFRFRSPPLQIPGHHILPAGQLDRPPLYSIDRHGTVRQEDHRSAEEVIRQWKEGNADAR
jgi:hypothetical protein